MQVKLGQELPDGFGTPLKQREHATDKALLHTSDPGPLERDRAVAQGELAWLAEAVAVPRLCVYQRTAFGAGATQQLAHFFLQNLLEALLHSFSGEILQCFPGGD